MKVVTRLREYAERYMTCPYRSSSLENWFIACGYMRERVSMKSIQLKNGQTVLLREAVKEDAAELVNYLSQFHNV